tara:strand:- start:560 stop:1066 length:507 start_codon:yes stop_codon:yes gene_type:complete
MKIIFIITLVIYSKIAICQEKWTLYPKGSTNEGDKLINKQDSSIKYKDSSLETFTFKKNYISGTGFLTISKDVRIDSLNKYLKDYEKNEFYSIQLSFSQETEMIKVLRKKFVEIFPDETLYDEYIAPNIYLYAGRFYSRNDAVFLKHKLDMEFENTMIVKKKFSVSDK